MKSRSGKRGFTLIELLVVISIIAMLLAIIAPSLNRCRGSSKRAICASRLKENARAIAIYADVYNGWLPFYGGCDPGFTELDPPNYRYVCKEDGVSLCPDDDERFYFAFHAVAKWCEDEDLNKPYPMKLGCLYRAGIIKDARIFYCPANPDPFYQYESYVDPPPWGSLPQKFDTEVPCGQRVRIGYTYYPAAAAGTIRIITNMSDLKAPSATARRYDKIDTRMPMLADVLWFRKTIAHRTKDSLAVNAAFKDTHVVYANDWRLFRDNPNSEDPRERLWCQWDPDDPEFTGKTRSNFFYYNFLKKIEP